MAMDYSLAPSNWKDLTNEQAADILERMNKDPENRDPM
jgi:hypothetical protein